MKAITSFVKGVVYVPVFFVTAWLLLAGGWQTWEMYRWANDKAEVVQQKASILNIFGE